VGIGGALNHKAKHGLHAEETTMAEVCKAAGYATAAYGKWHLGHLKPFLPVKHGFDDYFGYPYSNDMWPSGPVLFRDQYPLLPLIEDDEVVAHVRDQQWMTTWLTERSLRFIRENKEKPFFLYLAHPQPHVPLFVSPERAGKSGSLLGDVIQEIDWSTGEILAELEKQGLAENTWVIFTSDNGPWMVYGNHAGDTGGLKGSKGNVWEGGVRVPCVMRWPRKIKPGAVVETPLMTIDLLPTMANLLGVPLPERKIDGKDALSVITGERKESVQEAYYFYYGGNELQAMRMGRWKLVFPHRWREEKTHLGKDGLPGKYQHFKTELELYDLAADRNETSNVIANHPEVVAKMQKLAAAKRQDLGDGLQKEQGTGRRSPGLVKP
ncbi:MAG: sulfatase-like hydrolase/transferase, partial [Verrucomicrobiales bacterium]